MAPRSTACMQSDVDIAVVLTVIPDRRAERDRLADIAYEAVVETCVDVQVVPTSYSAQSWRVNSKGQISQMPLSLEFTPVPNVSLKGQKSKNAPSNS